MTADELPVLVVDDLRVVHPGARRGLGSHKGSDGVTAVDRVSLHVNRAEVVALIGESGSGKSSVALAVAGLGRVTNGSIRTLNQDMTKLRRRQRRSWRADVQIIFQDPHASLDPRQRIGSGLEELRHLHPERTSWITNDDLLQKVGLPIELISRLPSELSGGQAQRAVIARALLLQPKLLLADEPTSALDVSVQAQILNLLLSLKEIEGIAILLVTHDLSIVRHTADRIYVMQRGVIVEEGQTEQVLSAPENPYTRRLIDALPGKDHAVASTANRAGDA